VSERPYGTLRLSRREWFATVLGLAATSARVSTEGQPGGFDVVLPCTQTQTEEVEGMWAFGSQLVVMTQDKTLASCLAPLVSHDCEIRIVRVRGERG
jgi:hypothetical protein